MSFVRRGTIKRPHKQSAAILLHRIDGTPVRLQLRIISCREEHEMPRGGRFTTVYWDIASSTAVRESFDEIDKEINGSAVPS